MFPAVLHPALVVNGHSDVIIYTVNSFTLQQNIPNEQPVLYPNSTHSFMHQYPELSPTHFSLFLKQ